VRATVVTDHFRELIEAVEAAGYYTSFMRNDHGVCLVCVNGRREPWGLVGKSFSVWRGTDGTWLIHAWAGDTFQVPGELVMVTVCLDLLGCIDRDMRVPEPLVERYGLVRIDCEDSDTADAGP
jgi:hypothetical protein